MTSVLRVSSLFFAWLAFAQQATVQGVVTDATGASVPAAQIAIQNMQTGVQQTVDTNAQGFYSVPFLPASTR